MMLQSTHSSYLETETQLIRLQANNSSLSIQRPTSSETRTISMNQRASTSNAARMQAEQACFYRKTGAIVISMILWMVLAIDETNMAKKLENLSLLALCCIIYSLFENAIFCLRKIPARDETVQERIFDVLDGILALYFLLAIGFWKQENITNALLFFSLGLYLLTTGIYVKLAVTSTVSKIALIRRICFTIQVLLIIVKFTGSISHSWMKILLPLGLYLVGHQVYGSFVLIESSIQLIKRLNNGEINPLSFIRRSIKLSWNVVHYGLLLIAFRTLLNLCNGIEHGRHSEWPIKLFFKIAQYYSTLFLGYALIFSKLMGKLDSNVSLVKPKTARKKYSLVSQENPLTCEFLKISPTYFVKFDGNERSLKEMRSSEEEVMLDFKETEEEAFCYICEENNPDTILMGCGHGGMCKNCALLSAQKNSNCMQCRKPIELIYHITEEDKGTGTVKACEAFSIIY